MQKMILPPWFVINTNKKPKNKQGYMFKIWQSWLRFDEVIHVLNKEIIILILYGPILC